MYSHLLANTIHAISCHAKSGMWHILKCRFISFQYGMFFSRVTPPWDGKGEVCSILFPFHFWNAERSAFNRSPFKKMNGEQLNFVIVQ